MNRRKLKQRICIALSLVMVLLLVLALPVSAASKSKKKPSTATVTSVKSTAYNSATVRWKKAKYATSYRIYYKQFGAKKWIKLKDVNAKTTGYTHKSSKKYPLKAGKRYVYTVRAYNKYGKKWGNYNKNGKVVVIKRKKTVSQPNVVSKPVTSKPTATPVPTKKPQPTAKPKPTATLLPTATPTPEPIKATRIRFNPYPVGVTLTRQYPTYKLEVEVLPHEAESVAYKLTSSDTSIATVSADGTVTGTGDGTVTISVEALDGSCEGDTIVFDADMLRKPFKREVSLEGGDSKGVEIADYSDLDISDFSQVKFNFDSDDKEVIGDTYIHCDSKRYAYFGFTGYQAGTVTVTATYGDRLLGTYIITVTSRWDNYYGYEVWRKSIREQFWTDSMSVKEKLDAVQNYIKYKFVYGSEDGGSNKYWAYQMMKCDCWGATEMMGDFAADLGCKVKYCNGYGEYDDFSTAIGTAGGHQWNKILIDGEWIIYDATPYYHPSSN